MILTPDEEQYITELKRLALSLLGAVLTAAGLAALQWVGAHIPEWTSLLTMTAGARAAQIGQG